MQYKKLITSLLSSGLLIVTATSTLPLVTTSCSEAPNNSGSTPITDMDVSFSVSDTTDSSYVKTISFLDGLGFDNYTIVSTNTYLKYSITSDFDYEYSNLIIPTHDSSFATSIYSSIKIENIASKVINDFKEIFWGFKLSEYYKSLEVEFKIQSGETVNLTCNYVSNIEDQEDSEQSFSFTYTKKDNKITQHVTNTNSDLDSAFIYLPTDSTFSFDFDDISFQSNYFMVEKESFSVPYENLILSKCGESIMGISLPANIKLVFDSIVNISCSLSTDSVSFTTSAVVGDSQSIDFLISGYTGSISTYLDGWIYTSSGVRTNVNEYFDIVLDAESGNDKAVVKKDLSTVSADFYTIMVVLLLDDVIINTNTEAWAFYINITTS